MKRDYWNLSVSEFLDVISEVAEHRAYSVTLSNGREMKGTLDELSLEAIKYQNCDIGPELTNAVAEIRRNPIYQYDTLSFSEIIDYVDRWTQHYDPDRLRAFWVDAALYFYNNDKFDGTKAGAGKVQYLKRFLASKIDSNTGGDSVSPVADQFELPAGLNTPRAKKYFQKAIGRGLIIRNNDKMEWVGGSDARLAYFCQEVYCKDENGRDNGQNFPEKALNTLFGKSRLGKARSQFVSNNGGTPKNIDDLDELLNT